MEKENTEIEKLADRIAKDPKSKLFVPLAEEHKKAGDMETAISVLMEGLKHNPGYVTARSFLGRLLMDKGDLAGAQKELEEVIKTIPDNLLAQRKLGDIYVLQGRGTDALPRYKAALALNPGDKDLPLLIADLEAGKDVSSRLPKPKTSSQPAEIKPPSSPAASMLPKAAPAAGSLKSVAQTAAAAQSAAAAPGTKDAVKAASKAAAPVHPVQAAVVPPTIPSPPQVSDEAEVVEEILELEPLQRTVPGPVPATPAPLSESAPSPVPFDLSEPAGEQTTGHDLSETITWDAADAAVPEPEQKTGPDDSSDDLNTNTLAELYISQGFYDKAIEIYQGMLNDRPGNTALLNKLAQIKAMSGEADKSTERSTTAPRSVGEYSPPAEDAVVADSKRTKSAPVASPQRQEAPTQPTAMQPERIPPLTAHEPAGETSPPRTPQTATNRRKETIDRLESWLNTIMKEKKE